MIHPLTQAVFSLAQRLSATPDEHLDRPWAWQSYDSEGVRFGLFRSYEDLRELAARLHQQRATGPDPLNEGQRLLGLYHAAYRDLQAALLGLSSQQMTLAPNQTDWPIRQVIAHITGADVSFQAVLRYSLENHRAGNANPPPMVDADWTRLTGLDEPGYKALMEATPDALLAFLDASHTKTIEYLSSVQPAELDWLSRYWEKEPYTIRFRLLRLDSHLRQHTIQVDKTLALLGLAPNETRRLLRLIYAALAEAENARIGAPDDSPAEIAATAQAITTRGDELLQIVQADAP